MTSKREEERRRFPRSTRKIVVAQDDGDDGLINHVDNISCNGVLCHTIRPVPEMTRMAIVLDLPVPSERRIEAEGIVIRCTVEEPDQNEFKVAILFTRLSLEDHDAIQDHVEHELAHPGDE